MQSNIKGMIITESQDLIFSMFLHNNVPEDYGISKAEGLSESHVLAEPYSY